MKNFLSTAVLTLTICLGLIVNAKSNSADEFNQYLANTINYPEKARLAQLQGNSIVLFNLNRGKLSGLKIAAELGNGSDIEVVNAVMAYPGFSQMKDGKYAVHAAFRLEGANAELINKDAKLPDGYMAIHVVIQGKLPAEALVVTGYRQQPFKVSNGSGVVLRGNANPFAAKPLIILDSVQLDYADFQGIDPNGIESIH
ncbi:MAG: hypothetical protein REI93_10910, partial [Pedobacter sp.]|nr:hypothetical protein [Pedobacter sp.]